MHFKGNIAKLALKRIQDMEPNLPKVGALIERVEGGKQDLLAGKPLDDNLAVTVTIDLCGNQADSKW